jgi:hypothetical protein
VSASRGTAHRPIGQGAAARLLQRKHAESMTEKRPKQAGTAPEKAPQRRPKHAAHARTQRRKRPDRAGDAMQAVSRSGGKQSNRSGSTGNGRPRIPAAVGRNIEGTGNMHYTLEIAGSAAR